METGFGGRWMSGVSFLVDGDDGPFLTEGVLLVALLGLRHSRSVVGPAYPLFKTTTTMREAGAKLESVQCMQKYTWKAVGHDSSCDSKT